MARERLASFDWPEGADAVRSEVDTSCELALKAISGFCDVRSDPEGIFMAYRALRYAPYAMETLYPAAGLSMTVSQFFLEPDSRDDTLHKRIAAAGDHEDRCCISTIRGRKKAGVRYTCRNSTIPTSHIPLSLRFTAGRVMVGRFFGHGCVKHAHVGLFW